MSFESDWFTISSIWKCKQCDECDDYSTRHRRSRDNTPCYGRDQLTYPARKTADKKNGSSIDEAHKEYTANDTEKSHASDQNRKAEGVLDPGNSEEVGRINVDPGWTYIKLISIWEDLVESFLGRTDHSHNESKPHI